MVLGLLINRKKRAKEEEGTVHTEGWLLSLDLKRGSIQTEVGEYTSVSTLNGGKDYGMECKGIGKIIHKHLKAQNCV